MSIEKYKTVFRNKRIQDNKLIHQVDTQKSNLHIYVEKTNAFTIKGSKAIIVTNYKNTLINPFDC